MPDAGSWLPDGCGLDPASAEIVAERGLPVHLRLSSPGAYPRIACGEGVGEFWSGKATEVTCPACLEVVHA